MDESCSILKDGQDASVFSLQQVEDSPAEWCRRGINLLDNKLYGVLPMTEDAAAYLSAMQLQSVDRHYVCADFAEQCFATANDPIYGAVTWAIKQFQKTRKLSAPEKKACRAQVLPDDALYHATRIARGFSWLLCCNSVQALLMAECRLARLYCLLLQMLKWLCCQYLPISRRPGPRRQASTWPNLEILNLAQGRLSLLSVWHLSGKSLVTVEA